MGASSRSIPRMSFSPTCPCTGSTRRAQEPAMFRWCTPRPRLHARLTAPAMAQAITSSMRLYYESLGANAGDSIFRGQVKVCSGAF